MTHPKHQTHKVCLVPYVWREGEPYFLLHLPVAKNPDEQDQMIWGLVRGTVRDLQGNDLRSMEALHATPPEQIEDHWQTALHEAREECGLTAGDLLEGTVTDHGLMDYASPRKAPYPLHVFSAELKQGDLDRLTDRATDAAGLAFASLQDAREAAAKGELKAGYLSILQALTIA